MFPKKHQGKMVMSVGSRLSPHGFDSQNDLRVSIYLEFREYNFLMAMIPELECA